MLLACLVAWTLVAFDRLREGGAIGDPIRQPVPPPTLALPHKGGGEQIKTSLRPVPSPLGGGLGWGDVPGESTSGSFINPPA